MKKIDLIKSRIKTHGYDKAINKVNYYSEDDFISDGLRYIKAIKDERMCCIIDSVSTSGMSRTLRFVAPEKQGKRWGYMNFYAFFLALGYTRVKDSDYFRVYGCGMDMIFHTNYTNMHDLNRLGFMSKADCKTLAQRTPAVL